MATKVVLLLLAYVLLVTNMVSSIEETVETEVYVPNYVAKPPAHAPAKSPTHAPPKKAPAPAPKKPLVHPPTKVPAHPPVKAKAPVPPVAPKHGNNPNFTMN
ncbi:unnamed protein product [Ilex paraguariensis]|uniref:Uncharacterized protein n=1 Tax=Ilex paraguariensis TaxID=185542 RepID=A0ABC8T423_9AQUA